MVVPHHSSFPSTKHFCEIPMRALNTGRVYKCAIFLPIYGSMWETIQDRVIVTETVTGNRMRCIEP